MTGAVQSRTSNYGFALLNFDFPRWHGEEWKNWQTLDALIATYLALPTVEGPWQNSTTYAVGDRVVDPDAGTLWLCAVAHTSDAAPTTFAEDRTANPTYWDAISSLPVNREAWLTATGYSIGDIVTVDTYDVYYCVEAHTSGTFATDLAAGKWVLMWEGTVTVDAAEAAQAAAEAAQTAAETAQTAAETAKTAAETAETNAETAETNAETAATNAANSATAAATSATNAADSATAAATSETNAATSETNAANSATAAASSATSAANSYDAFDDRYLGSKAADPTLDNDGNALLTGALYWNTGDNSLRVYTGSAWSAINLANYLPLSGGTLRHDTAETTTVSRPLIIAHATSGLAAAGFGVGIEFNAEEAAGNVQSIGLLDFSWLDATNGSEDSVIRFYSQIAGVLTNILSMSGSNGLQQFSANAYAMRNFNAYTGSTTWNRPTGCRAVLVVCVGGGGGGGGANNGGSGYSAGNGGGGGGIAIAFVDSPGASETITIGAAGTAGTTAANGGAGGTTSFGTHCVATGGAGGASMTTGATTTVGRAGGSPALGGIGTSGDFVLAGGAGQLGIIYSTSAVGGMGGQSMGGGGQPTTESTAGQSGRPYGGGGSGAATPGAGSGLAGGAGYQGICFLVELF